MIEYNIEALTGKNFSLAYQREDRVAETVFRRKSGLRPPHSSAVMNGGVACVKGYEWCRCTIWVVPRLECRPIAELVNCTLFYFKMINFGA